MATGSYLTPTYSRSQNKYFKRNCPNNKGVDNKRLNVNKVSTEVTELEDGTVAARVDLVGKVIPRGAIEDKLSKLGKSSISVDGKLVHALVDYAVKCPLVCVPIDLATGGQVNVVHQQVLCALAEYLVEDVLLPPDVLDMLGGAQSEENSLAQSSQDLRVDSGNVDETEVSLGILPEKAQEHIEYSQRNITLCRNAVGKLVTKDEEVTAEMDKGSMVADSFRSEQECCAELALAWKHAKEGKGNYYEVDGYLFHRDKILGESIGQLVVNMDLIGPIDPPSSKGHKYILCLVDQHTRWGEAVPLTSLSAKVFGMLEQFVLSRIVDIDILRQIWKNRVKQINCVLEWVRWVGSEIIPAKGKLEP
ncbi:CCHC-type domain-containing protein [Trichonephila clavipes]|nr:CCHC-type domain-containing protein [Trichonephila clavipes]